MIQNKINLVDVNSIQIKDRQRKEIDPLSLEELALAISSHSLIHPILIEPETNNLIAGERRLRAFQLAESSNLPCPDKGYDNWKKIPARYAKDVSPDEVFEIELIENLSRRDLAWTDEAIAIAQLHKRKAETNLSWSQKDTGRVIGRSQSSVSNAITVANALLSGNQKLIDMVKETSGIKSAALLIERVKSRSGKSILDSAFKRNTSDKAQSPDSDKAQLLDPAIQNKPTTPAPKSDIILLNEDFNSWAATYSGPPFNFLHLDFPYGINLTDSLGMKSRRDHNSYDDSFGIFEKLLETLSLYQENLIAPSAHIMFWFSQTHRRFIEDFFMAHFDCEIKDHLMVWNCSDNSGIIPDPEYYGRRNYETAMLIVFERRKIVKPISLCCSYPRNFPGKLHRSEKPLDVLRHFLKMFIDESTIFGDFTCGSGTSLQVARELKAKHILGLEIDPEMFKEAQAALDNPSLYFSSEI